MSQQCLGAVGLSRAHFSVMCRRVTALHRRWANICRWGDAGDLQQSLSPCVLCSNAHCHNAVDCTRSDAQMLQVTPGWLSGVCEGMQAQHGQLEVCAIAALCTDLMTDSGSKTTPRNTL